MKSSSWFRPFLPCVALAGMLALQFGCDRAEWAKSLPGGGENAQQRKVHSNTNLKSIALGIHNYASAMKAFPPAYIADKKASPC